ncbi:MAG: phage integrase SAM-like domain-containing protein [Bacteroidia bacterium]
MAEVKFYLEKRKDKQTGKVVQTNVPILLFYSFNGKRLQYYTGYRIDASKWDDGLAEKDGKVIRLHPGKVKKNYSEAADINKELTKLESRIIDIHQRADVLGERLSEDYFKERLNGNKLDTKNSDTIWEAYEKYLEALKVTHTEKSIYNVKSTFKVLRWFETYRKKKITFDEIDENFWQEFFSWCYQVQGYYNNYTGTHVNKLKAFLNWALAKKLTTCKDFQKQSKMQEFIEVIYLEYKEVQKFFKFRFKNDKESGFTALELSDMRDLYCGGCFTGMRHSDISNLREENDLSVKISYRVKKTKQTNFVPVNKFSRQLIDKHKGRHNGFLFPQFEDNVRHELLRVAMKQAGLNRMVQIVHYRGAERQEESMPLWKAANFHTSKKTFVVNFLEKGGSLTTAMAITGNRSHSVFRRYYKIADTFKAKEMERIFGKVA